MSMLIRGLELPKEGHVIVRIYADGKVYESTSCAAVWNRVATAVPVADVQPVVKGGWIRRCDSVFARCPNCKCEVMQLRSVVFRDEGHIDFCPNCGIKIEGDEDDVCK